MRRLDFYYYCLYNLSYKDGLGLQEWQPRRALPFEHRPILLFTLGSSGWLILFTMIVKLYKPTLSILSMCQYEFFGCLTIIYTAGFFYFVNSNRYTNIYSAYRQTDKSKEQLTRKKLLIVLLLPWLLISVLHGFNKD
jgi:hypothetical protein